MRAVLSALLLCTLWIAPALAQESERKQADTPTTQRAEKRVLVFNRADGFKHGSIPTSADVFRQMDARSDAFQFVVTDDIKHFDPQTLNTFDAVVFCLTTGEIPLTDQQKQALLTFVKSGRGGLVGIHSATDTFYKWPEFGEMMGGYFDGHPWNAGDTVTIKIEQVNPITAPWGKSRFQITDEIYQIRDPYDRRKQEVLLSLDTERTDMNKQGIKRTDNDFAVAWTKTYGDGRVFYTSLGHNDAVWRDRRYQAHLLAGLQWVTRAEQGKAVAEKSKP